MAVSFQRGVGRAGWSGRGGGAGAAAAVLGAAAAAAGGVRLKFSVPREVAYGQEVRLVSGQCSWEVEQAQSMRWQEGDVWTAEVAVPAGLELQYKYVVAEHGAALEWMGGDNYAVQVPETDNDVVVEVSDQWGQASKQKVQLVNGTVKDITASVSGARQALEELADGGEPGEGAPAPDYRRMKVKELKALLKERGLPLSGKKADLVARLEG